MKRTVERQCDGVFKVKITEFTELKTFQSGVCVVNGFSVRSALGSPQRPFKKTLFIILFQMMKYISIW